MADGELHLGDCLDVLPRLGEGAVDAVVCDPPYGLEFMGKNWDRLGCFRDGHSTPATSAWREKTGQGGFAALEESRSPRFYQSVKYGPEMQAWHQQWAAAALRVLKPGGYLLAFGGTRTWHRLACALEDAGFEMRDTILSMSGAPSFLCWAYGSGFPKGPGCLKPAWEPVIWAQKPLNDTVEVDRIIAETTAHVEALLWQLSPARFVEFASTPPRRNCGTDESTVRWLATTLYAVRSIGRSDLMAMFSSPGAASTFLSIAWLWGGILDVLCSRPNTSTTGTASGLTTGLRTLNCLISQTTPASIIEAATRSAGLWWSADSAGSNSSAPAPGSPHTPKSFAPENATWLIANVAVSTLASIAGDLLRLPPVTSECSAGTPAITPTGRPDVDTILSHIARASDSASPAWEPILLCRKPGPRVLPLGVEECRVGTETIRSSGDMSGMNGQRFKHGTRPRNYSDGVTPEPSEHVGRWPPNLVLTHDARCRRVGTRRVKGHHGYPNGPGGSSCQFSQKGTPTTRDQPWEGYADADGLETVAAWECVESCPVRLLDEQSGDRSTRDGTADNRFGRFGNAACYGKANGTDTPVHVYGDTGGASRFFSQFGWTAADDVPFRYCAKAPSSERWFVCRDCNTAFPQAERDEHGHGHADTAGKQTWGHISAHPTQKPLDLVKWLVKLVSAPGQMVLDPFVGSGTTALACWYADRRCIGIERDGSYMEIARRRLAAARAETPLFAEAP